MIDVGKLIKSTGDARDYIEGLEYETLRSVIESKDKVVFDNIDKALSEPGVQIRIFGKPEVKGHRRMAVILATADSVEEAIKKADRAASELTISALPR